MKLKQLDGQNDAEKIIDFFFSGNAFTWELPETQKRSVRERINNALIDSALCRYWYFEEERDKVVAAGAIQKDEDSTNDGYFIGWLGVHEGYRRKGLGKKIIQEAEKFVKSVKGRFITVETGEDNKEANNFYTSLGYKRVGLIPKYYNDSSGKVTYFKKL